LWCGRNREANLDAVAESFEPREEAFERDAGQVAFAEPRDLRLADLQPSGDLDLRVVADGVGEDGDEPAFLEGDGHEGESSKWTSVIGTPKR